MILKHIFLSLLTYVLVTDVTLESLEQSNSFKISCHCFIVLKSELVLDWLFDDLTVINTLACSSLSDSGEDAKNWRGWKKEEGREREPVIISAAPSLPSFLPFYFRVRAFSIQRTRLSRSLEQVINTHIIWFCCSVFYMKHGTEWTFSPIKQAFYFTNFLDSDSSVVHSPNHQPYHYPKPHAAPVLKNETDCTQKRLMI